MFTLANKRDPEQSLAHWDGATALFPSEADAWACRDHHLSKGDAFAKAYVPRAATSSQMRSGGLWIKPPPAH